MSAPHIGGLSICRCTSTRTTADAESARGLYASLFKVLGVQGFFNAYAGIALPNAASVALHEAVAFRTLGVYERVGYKLGAWHDVGWWQLVLKAHAGLPEEPRLLAAVLSRPDWEGLVKSGEAFTRTKAGLKHAT